METKSPSFLKNRNAMLLLLLAACVCFNAVIWMLIVSPVFAKNNSVKDKAADAEMKLTDLQNQFVEEKISEEQIEKLAAQIPDQFEDSVTLKQLLQVAEDSKVLLANFAISSGKTADSQSGNAAQASSNTLTYELVLAGHLDNLVAFIGNLQQSERLFTVRAWSFNELTNDLIERDYSDIYNKAYTDKGKEVLSLHITVDAFATGASAS